MKKYNNITTRIKELDSIKKLMSKNSDAKALSELKKYMEKYPTDDFGKFLYGRLLTKTGDRKKAQEVFKEVAASNANNKYSALEALAELAFQEGEISLARTYYHEVLEKSPNNESHALLSLVRLERKEKNYQEALSILKKAPKEDLYIQLEKAKIYNLQNNLSKSSVIINEIPTTENENFNREVLLEKGRIEKNYECYDTATKLYEEAKSTKKDSIYYQAIYEQAKLSLKLSNFNQTIDYCEELLAKNYCYEGEVYIILGLAKEHQELYEEARKYYAEATLSSDKKLKGEASYHLGSLELAAGNFSVARENLQLALENNEDFYKSTYFKLIALCIREENYQEASFYLEKLKHDYPQIVQDISYTIASLVIEKKDVSIPLKYTEQYICNQLLTYDLEKTKHHIKERKLPFSKNINISVLMLEVSESLDKLDRLNNEILDVYDIKYPGIGRQDNKVLNTLRVVTIPNTKNILTMYPAEKKKSPCPRDFKDNKKHIKKKVSSQINKFNKKYNLD